jgi:hypothetical protein
MIIRARRLRPSKRGPPAPKLGARLWAGVSSGRARDDGVRVLTMNNLRSTPGAGGQSAGATSVLPRPRGALSRGARGRQPLLRGPISRSAADDRDGGTRVRPAIGGVCRAAASIPFPRRRRRGTAAGRRIGGWPATFASSDDAKIGLRETALHTSRGRERRLPAWRGWRCEAVDLHREMFWRTGAPTASPGGRPGDRLMRPEDSGRSRRTVPSLYGWRSGR